MFFSNFKRPDGLQSHRLDGKSRVVAGKNRGKNERPIRTGCGPSHQSPGIFILHTDSDDGLTGVFPDETSLQTRVENHP